LVALSAISRYLVSNTLIRGLHVSLEVVSIRYIAVLGFQLVQWVEVTRVETVSIRYIAVLGFQRQEALARMEMPYWFPSAISRYLVSNT